MFELFANYLRSKAAFTAGELQQLEAASVVRRLRKRQYLLREGEVWVYNAFVASGCLRTYTVDAKGAEHVLNFAIENWWTGDRLSLTSGQPSRLNIDAVEDATVVLLKNDEFEHLRQAIPALHELVNDTLHRSFLASQTRIHAAISYSAEEKYRAFLMQFPALVRRVPQHMVASYLGMTTETLSRIRHRLAQEPPA